MQESCNICRHVEASLKRSGGKLSFLRAAGSEPDPEAFLKLVLDGWAASMRARGDKKPHVMTSRAAVMQLCDHSGKYPWEWLYQDATEWLDHLRGVKALAHSTVRGYQGMVQAFCEYATSPAHDWSEKAVALFGSVFTQVITEFNRVSHGQESQKTVTKRPFSRRELQQLFDLMDLEYERVLKSKRSGALTALRDAAAFKIAYAWGLREYETSRLQVVDLSPNGRAPQFGDYGNLHVRFGKGSAGQPFKERNVLTVFDWAAEVMDDWVNLGLPRYGEPLTDLFPTNRGTTVSPKHLWRKMDEFLDELGFPAGLDFHSLRRAYATHLLTEYKFDLKFVQLQLGHEHAATTAAYTLPAADFQTTELHRVHQEMLSAGKMRPPTARKKLKLPPLPPLRRRGKSKRGANET